MEKAVEKEFSGDMKILVWDPPHHLRTSWSFGEGEAPAQITDYMIEAKGGRTAIRAVTSGFPLDASWDGWVEGTNRGWAFELRSLKHYLEHHDGEARHVIYLRRRVPQSPEEVWAKLQASSFGRWLEAGEAFDDRPASQYAAIVDDPADAMLRISVEPGGPGTTTALARARFDDDRLTELQDLFVAEAWSNGGAHFGSRLAFDANFTA
mgnify:CR=1 FL=1